MPPGQTYSRLPGSDPEDADDERSIHSLDGRNKNDPSDPSYAGQDTRPTSQKELLGWYSYAWAAEVFVVCGIGSFIPVTLEQLARENGVQFGDKTTPCGSSSTIPSIPSAMFDKDGTCVIRFFGWWMNTASFAMYTFSISVLLQSLIIISMSGAADHGSYRKRLLLAFAFLGSLGTMMFITVTPNTYLFSALWATIGNVGFGASFVLLNAFLPVLVRQHPKILFKDAAVPASVQAPVEDSGADTDQTLLNETVEDAPTVPVLEPIDKRGSPELQLSTQISSYGIAIGYSAAVLLQIGCIFLVLLYKSTTFSLQIVLFIIGAWWFLFSIPTAIWIRPRPGPPLPKIEGQAESGLRMWWEYVRYAWVGLYHTILKARRLKDVMLFLAAWFMISDGVATVSGTAVLFAKTNLHMSPAALALISVITMVTGVIGAFAWSRIGPYFDLSPSRTILACICVFVTIPIYGLLGFIPFIKKLGYFGLVAPWEMYLLGSVYGFVMGGISGYCRSVFGELIPPGSEAAFFALYAITDKGSSIFGPAIVGMITDKMGDIRYAFWFLAVLIAIPIPILACVDVERGRREGRELALEELRESRRHD
ncbi:MFS general substrate transporter [Ascobolus immersus RN42]|uniref:Autophagy-related protein n=1 Tax=Ascobolus immersus RN42 TaxID=1160509 RepID=A0A3N4ID08_ASCIM|nr:MFS general substrate transporter [Ascobolus immersus RN42]